MALVDRNENCIIIQTDSESGSDESDDELSQLLADSENFVKTEPVDEEQPAEPVNKGSIIREFMRDERMKNMPKRSDPKKSNNNQLTREDYKAIYEKDVNGEVDRDSDSSRDRKRSRSPDYDPSRDDDVDPDDDIDPDSYDKSLISLLGKGQKRKKSRKSDFIVIEDDDDKENADVKLDPDEEVGEYSSTRSLMKLEFVTKETLRMALTNINTTAITHLVKHIAIDVKALKFKGEILEGVNWERNEQRVEFRIRFTTYLRIINKTYALDMEPFISNDVFQIKKLIDQISTSIADPNHPSSVRGCFSKPQNPDRIPASVLCLNRSIIAGKKCFSYMKKRVFIHDSVFFMKASMLVPRRFNDNFDKSSHVEKTDSDILRRKKILQTRFFIKPEVPDDDFESLRASTKKIATITLQCSGDGFDCYTKCGTRIKETEHTDFDTKGQCICGENLKTASPMHLKCQFKIILYMFSDKINEWRIAVPSDNLKYHPHQCPVAKEFEPNPVIQDSD